MLRFLKWIGLGLLAALSLFCVALYLALTSSLIDTSQTFTLVGAEGAIEISRDEHGIPTIRAQSETDLYQGLGFAHAQDRLWQMEMARRAGQGRLSEILGSNTIGIDRFFRTLDLVRVAEENWQNLATQARQKLEAYTQGINQFLDQRSGLLPPEFLLLWTDFEPWQPAHSMLMSKLLALDLSKNWRDERLRQQILAQAGKDLLQSLWPDLDLDDHLSIDDRTGWLAPETPNGLGSNIWALKGSSTESGQALFANDPHLNLQTPGTWYLVRLEAPTIRAVGATIPALPALIIGRNQDISWGFTNSGADTQDLFVETIDPNNPEQYLTPEGSAPFEQKPSRIFVRGQEPIDHTVRWSRHGPILSDLNGQPQGLDDQVIALAWTSLLPDDRTFEAGLELLTARNFDEFRAAIRKFDGPTQNAYYADRSGNIGALIAGLVPVRQSGDGRLARPGHRSEFDWQGYLPFFDKPSWYNPEQGWLANANNAVVDESYPHNLTKDWDPDDRYRRIVAELKRLPRTLQGMKALQTDGHSTLADDFLPLLMASNLDHPAKQALMAWDRHMDRDAPEPLILHAWYRNLVASVFAPKLGELWPQFGSLRTEMMREIINRRPDFCDDPATSVTETCQDLAEAAFIKAIDDLALIHGEDWRAWRWGEASKAIMAHRPFHNIPLLNHLFDIEIERDGGPTSPDVARYAFNRPYQIRAAASMRLIVDWSDPEAIHIIPATGQSGHFLSPHYDDLSQIWASGGYLRIVLP